MLKVSPLPSLPQLRAHQQQSRGSTSRILFKTRKGAKLKPQKWHLLDFLEDEAPVAALVAPTTPPSSSLVFEMETLPIAKSTNNAIDLQLIFDELSFSFKNWAQTLPIAIRRLIAGGIAGAVSKTATAPLEAIKLQVVQGHTDTLNAARMLYFSGGFGAFFRGNGLDVGRSVVGKGIELAAFDSFKKAILSRKKEDNLVPDAVALAVAGAVAGILSTLATHPLETLRTRLAVGACGGGRSPLTISAWSCIAEIVRNEGVGALFRGLDASIIGIMPYAAIRLCTYDALKSAYKRATGDEHLNPRAALVFGAVAGVASAVATFPLEVARRRMMAGTGGPYGNVGVALVAIVSKEGVGALFRGVELTIIKQAPQYALGFASYEMAKRALAL